MIIREYYETRIDGVKLYRSYSDSDKLILQNETGEKYTEAIDVETANYTYSETDESIDIEEEESDIETLKAQLAAIQEVYTE